VIIDKIDIDCIARFESKDDPPIPADRYAPKTLQVAGKRVKTKAWGNHVFRGFGRIQTG
jgi:hypothetical protein